jgi:hypothetical protein
VVLPAQTYKVIQRFNRNTTWVAMGLVAPVIFAALMVVLQERHPKVNELTEEPRQTRDDILPNANPVALSDPAPSNEKGIGEMTSRQATNACCGLTPAVQSNGTLPSPTLQPDSQRVNRSKFSNVRRRSSVRPRVASVKMRLIAPWQQSLAAISKKSGKKVGHTFAMSH